MTGALAWSPDQWQGMTLRQLIMAFDAYVVDRWDHTALLSTLIYNLSALVHNAVAKTKTKPKSVYDFHQYRAKPKRGLSVHRGNFNVLYSLGNALSRQHHR